MNRREIIKTAAVLGLTTALSGKRLWAFSSKETASVLPFHRFTLGSLELTVVTDGHIAVPRVQPFFAPGVDSNKVSKLLHDNFLPTHSSDLSLNVLVIKNGSKVILIDAGCGQKFGPNSGWLVENLANADIKSEAVTDIVISHAHPDHLGGLVTNEGDLVFRNAVHHISKTEAAFWTSATPDFSKSKLVDPAMIQMVTGVAASTLAAVKTKIHLFGDGDALLDCIRVNIVPGHTPGHTVTTIYSGGEELVHVADLVHSPILVFAHPEWGFEGDQDFNLAVISRKATLEKLAAGRKMVFSYHLPWPGIGHVKKQSGAYEWIAANFAIPG